VNVGRRSPPERISLFGNGVNSRLLSQGPAPAHRNRVTTLTQRLIEETARTRGLNRPARFYNLGCGPAQEVRAFMEQSPLSDHAEFTLLDFNEETLAYTRTSLDDARRRHHRATPIQLAR